MFEDGHLLRMAANDVQLPSGNWQRTAIGVLMSASSIRGRLLYRDCVQPSTAASGLMSSEPSRLIGTNLSF